MCCAMCQSNRARSVVEVVDDEPVRGGVVEDERRDELRDVVRDVPKQPNA
jgi:hypothetical protein